MTPFDLLFIVLALATAASLVVAACAAATGHRRSAGRILLRLAGGAAAYLAVVYAVALASSARVLALGEDLCSDDWCMAVTEVREAPHGAESLYDVTFRLSSRARRVSQRERGVLVYVRDAGGRRYEGESGPADAPFDVQLGPSQTVTTQRRFFLPQRATARDIVLTHEGIPFPGCCIIGEANGLLHPAAVRVP